MGNRLRVAIQVALSAVVLAWPSQSVAGDKPTRVILSFEGQNRTYYLFVPTNPSKKPAPLVVLLHGSGRDGRSLLDKWQALADKEGIVLAGPESKDRRFWAPDTDGPAFLYAVIEAVKEKHAVDPKRVYVFGHSAGAVQAISMAVLESEYLAAVAAHAGVLQKELQPYLWIAAHVPADLGVLEGPQDLLDDGLGQHQREGVRAQEAFDDSTRRPPGVDGRADEHVRVEDRAEHSRYLVLGRDRRADFRAKR